MATVEVVENPRRRRRRGGRRHLTRKQIAAGFGGRSAMGGRRSRRRRNPALATLAANPRRRRYRASRSRRRSRRSYSNPSLFGGLRSFDLGAAAWVAAGVVIPKYGLRLLSKQFPQIPTTGIMGYVVRAGVVFGSAWAAKTVTRSSRAFPLVMAGGLGMILVDVFNEYVAPKIGLTGLGDDMSLVDSSELDDALAGYQPTEGNYRSMSGYEEGAAVLA